MQKQATININGKDYTLVTAYFVTTDINDLTWIGYVDIRDGERALFNQPLTRRKYEGQTPEAIEDIVALEVDTILNDGGKLKQSIVDRIMFWQDAVAKGYVQEYNAMQPIPNDLETVRGFILQGITTKYNEKLTAGFTSSASGKAVSFAYGETDQVKFHKLLTAMTANLVPYPYNVWDKDGKAVPLTQVQLQTLFRDIMIFENGLQTKLHTLIDQAKAATTIAQLNTIQVVF